MEPGPPPSRARRAGWAGSRSREARPCGGSPRSWPIRLTPFAGTSIPTSTSSAPDASSAYPPKELIALVTGWSWVVFRHVHLRLTSAKLNRSLPRLRREQTHGIPSLHAVGKALIHTLQISERHGRRGRDEATDNQAPAALGRRVTSQKARVLDMEAADGSRPTKGPGRFRNARPGRYPHLDARRGDRALTLHLPGQPIMPRRHPGRPG